MTEVSTLEKRIRQLIALSLRGLGHMQNKDGLFCEEVILAGPLQRRKSSLRYSLVCLIGMSKAVENGYSVPCDLDKLWNTLMGKLADCADSAGDLGLYLWANSLLERNDHHVILDYLCKLLTAPTRFRLLDGMERSWILCGLLFTSTSGNRRSEGLLNRLLPTVLTETVSPSGLFYHFCYDKWRKRYPNFATQVYAIQAFTLIGQMCDDNRLLRIAKRAADMTCQLQLPNGAWPWLYDARSGTVVERYEIYSVHQDAMAPMMLLPLFQVTGDEKLLYHTLKGLNWIYDNNLGKSMADPDRSVVLRSIRRRFGGAFFLYTSIISHLISKRPFQPETPWLLEINPTCRPYHLGWLLQAWCGIFPEKPGSSKETEIEDM